MASSIAPSLRCNICPKKPKFSDISHLLTHVSSKGHLSHYFKLQVRSHQETDASELLDTYDRWYQENDLAELLSQRMLTKDVRKSRSRSKLPKIDTTTPIGAMAHHKGSKQKRHAPDYLDPRLTQPFLDSEPRVQSLDRSRRPTATEAARHAAGPRAQLFSTNTNRRSTMPNLSKPSEPWEPDRDTESDDDMSPIGRARRPSTISKSAYSRKRAELSPDPFVDEPSLPKSIRKGGNTGDKGSDEMAKLKGVLWPGMDIFDSATEQMRKKRNQKKDGKTLKRMEKNSEDIEPTELVFSPGGTLRKERLISGMVDDSSPLKGETPIPKRRLVRPKRAPLARTDPNRFNPTARGGLLGKQSSNGQARSLEELSRQTLPLIESPTMDRSLRYFDSRYSPMGEENSDFKLTFGGFDQKKRRGGFSVFNDDEPQMRASNQRHHRENPFGSYLNPNSLSQQHQPQTSNAFSSSLPKNYSSHQPSNFNPSFPGKENIEPMMAAGGHINTTSGDWSGHHVSDAEYRPQYLFGATPHDFGTYGDNDMAGYSSNPLSYSMHPMQSLRDHSDRPAGGSFYYGDLRTEQERLTDATISDAEREISFM
ncbi:hypothetical protein FQN54_006453 [Arachnomyces sp. PD_36]|nr:hypothetical protein FQN54_006453 [Arachnomyces sp. PD_36]